MPQLSFTPEANEQLDELAKDKGQASRLKAVRAALGKMQQNLRHPGLKTHKFDGETCPHGGQLFEAYAQNKTPGAFRIFWCYSPPPPNDTILIVSITEHP